MDNKIITILLYKLPMYDPQENNIKLKWNFNFELPVVTKCHSDKLILDMQVLCL